MRESWILLLAALAGTGCTHLQLTGKRPQHFCADMRTALLAVADALRWYRHGRNDRL
jgi:hypothetical protein